MGLFEIFAWILAFFYSLIPSYGLAIILLTLTTRIVLLPLSIKQTRSMREMQVIQPQVKALQKKFKGDRQKLNEEMMKLYKEHGVNPLGGCLPLVLQLPVLFGLFYVIREPLKYLSDDAKLAQDLTESPLAVHQFLGIRLDCSPAMAWAGNGSDVIPQTACGTGNPFVAALPYLLLLAFMGFTTYYQQKQMQASRGSDPQAQQMQMIGKIMPAFLIFIGFNFPAGVLIYWFASNLWTIVQQRIILKAAPPIVSTGTPATAKALTGKASSAKAKPSSAKSTTAKSTSAKGNGATKTKSKPHPSSKKKKR
jgi:YidC/Oxa1 family membrane protein insertase